MWVCSLRGSRRTILLWWLPSTVGPEKWASQTSAECGECGESSSQSLTFCVALMRQVKGDPVPGKHAEGHLQEAGWPCSGEAMTRVLLEEWILKLAFQKIVLELGV